MIQGVDTVIKNLHLYQLRMKSRFSSGMKSAMAGAESQSKQTAPWKDRTGNARNSIFGYSNDEGAKIVGYHGIGMFYGVYLELSNQGKYRVIWPTMDWLRARLLSFVANG